MLKNYLTSVWRNVSRNKAFGLVVIFVALATVSIHTLKAARTNPVKSLRYE